MQRVVSRTSAKGTNMKLERLPKFLLLFSVLTWVAVVSAHAQSGDPLPSWRNTPQKEAVIEFVKAVSVEEGPEFVPVASRIATFDMDGTILIEKPVPVNFEFVQQYLQTV
jgi:hypothetical protein